MRHLRQALVAMCGGLVMGCEPSPHDTAVEDAQKAASRGDLAVAAKRFTDACKMQTDDEESCAAAVKSTDAFGNMVMARAKVACEAGDAHTCAATFKDYRELRPTDVRMREMLGKAAAAHVEKCEALERPDSINSILERAKCAVSVQAEVRDSRYDRLIESERNMQPFSLC